VKLRLHNGALLKVFIEGLSFTGRHGVYEEERRDGRLFCVDLSVEIDFGGQDTITNTLDYRGLAECILLVGNGPSVDLIETMGERIVDTVFETYPEVTQAEIKVRKKATGVPGEPEWVGMQLSRSRK
jgi:dihydroneopterin aldolase